LLAGRPAWLAGRRALLAGRPAGRPALLSGRPALLSISPAGLAIWPAGLARILSLSQGSSYLNQILTRPPLRGRFVTTLVPERVRRVRPSPGLPRLGIHQPDPWALAGPAGIAPPAHLQLSDQARQKRKARTGVTHGGGAVLCSLISSIGRTFCLQLIEAFAPAPHDAQRRGP
jgi:hypothetical protein